jgi:hypothetical protein
LHYFPLIVEAMERRRLAAAVGGATNVDVRGGRTAQQWRDTAVPSNTLRRDLLLLRLSLAGEIVHLGLGGRCAELGTDGGRCLSVLSLPKSAACRNPGQFGIPIGSGSSRGHGEVRCGAASCEMALTPFSAAFNL